MAKKRLTSAKRNTIERRSVKIILAIYPISSLEIYVVLKSSVEPKVCMQITVCETRDGWWMSKLRTIHKEKGCGKRFNIDIFFSLHTIIRNDGWLLNLFDSLGSYLGMRECYTHTPPTCCMYLLMALLSTNKAVQRHKPQFYT